MYHHQICSSFVSYRSEHFTDCESTFPTSVVNFNVDHLPSVGKRRLRVKILYYLYKIQNLLCDKSSPQQTIKYKTNQICLQKTGFSNMRLSSNKHLAK